MPQHNPIDELIDDTLDMFKRVVRHLGSLPNEELSDPKNIASLKAVMNTLLAHKKIERDLNPDHDLSQYSNEDLKELAKQAVDVIKEAEKSLPDNAHLKAPRKGGHV